MPSVLCEVELMTGVWVDPETGLAHEVYPFHTFSNIYTCNVAQCHKRHLARDEVSFSKPVTCFICLYYTRFQEE